MTIYEYDSEEELDEAFERIEELNMDHVDLKAAVEEARKNLEDCQEKLSDFEEENKEFLLG